MARRVIGFRLTASQPARPVDDFDLQFLTLHLDRLQPTAQDRALRQLVSQAYGRGLLKTGDNHIFEFERRNQNLDMDRHPPFLTDNGSLGHVENPIQRTNMIQSSRQILRALVVDLECDDRQLPATDRACGRHGRARRHFVERQRPQTITDAGQNSRAESVAAARQLANASAQRRACADEVARKGGARRCDPLARNAVVDNR
jgi:hypothetical protein